MRVSLAENIRWPCPWPAKLRQRPEFSRFSNFVFSRLPPIRLPT